MSWICTGCYKVVDPQHVTYAELHDPRQGGCGAPVKAVKAKRDTLATRLAAVERERDALREGLESTLPSLIALTDWHVCGDGLAPTKAQLAEAAEVQRRITALLGKENTDGQ